LRNDGFQGLHKMNTQVMAGIDVGGSRKGFHGVAMKGGKYVSQFASAHADGMAAWCREISAVAVGIDAPCRWSETGHARLCESSLEINGNRISCFATPTRVRAEEIAFYAWMLNGAKLFAALEVTHRLLDDDYVPGRPVCFETFPQAVACALAGERVSAKQKRTVRRALLAKAGIATQALTNIDLVDAALCALAAQRLVEGRFRRFGEARTGYIVTPAVEASA
jgi:predicted nuclease with RNAse H fold